MSQLLEKIAYGFIVAAMLFMSVVYFAQVVFRYVLEVPLPWAGEASVLAMLWLTFVGSAVLVRKGGLVSVPLLKLKGRAKAVLSIALDLVAAVLLGFLTGYAAYLALEFREDALPATGLSRAFVYLAIFCGCLLMLFCFLEKAWASLKSLGPGKAKSRHG